MLSNKMHPRIAELALALMPLVENAPSRPTQSDRDVLMSLRTTIKNLCDEPGIELSGADETDRQYLYVTATQLANRQEEFYEQNGNKFAPRSKEQLQALGGNAPILEVLETFTDGPNHDWAKTDITNIKNGLQSERKRFSRMSDMASYTVSDLTGPQCRYAGNKTLSWIGWVLRQFGLEHKLTGY